MKKYILIAAICITACLLFLISSVYAADDAEELLKEGIAQFRHESYDEALETFKRVKKLNPDLSLCEYYLGLTYKKMENLK